MFATIVTTDEELQQINRLNTENYRHTISAEQRDKEGFVSWPYPMERLQKIQALAPQVIAKEGDTVVGYALVTVKETAAFHNDLQHMFDHLSTVCYNGTLLKDCNYYVMGQVCIDKPWRGKGVFAMLFTHHKKVYSDRFDMVITEISVSNVRSQKAHEKVGFKTIYTYTDEMDTWSVVAWDWK